MSTEANGWGFIDALKKVLRGSGPVVVPNSNSFGPINPTVNAPLAGIALHAVSKLADQESSSGEGAESQVAAELDNDGVTQRAILGEAALQAIGLMSEKDLQDSGILTTMNEVYSAHADAVRNLVPYISKVLLEQNLHIPNNQSAPDPSPEPPIVGAENSSELQEGSEALVNSNSFGSFWDLLKDKVCVAVPATSAPLYPPWAGLAKLDQAITSKQSFSNDSQDYTAAEELVQRALLGEAALQAMMKLPKEYTHYQYPVGDSETFQTNGWFKTLIGAAQKIAPHVMKVAPKVLDVVVPIVKELS